MNSVHFENKTVSRNFFWFLWMTYAFVYMTKNCFSAALAAIVQDGIMTKTQTGVIVAVFYLIYAPLQVVGGHFADKYDPEKLIIVGLFGSSVANFAIYFNQNYYFMLVVWALNAACQFAIWPAIFKIVSSQIIRSDRKSSAFYITLASSAGLMFAYFFAAIIPKWQYNFLLSGIVLLFLGISLVIICKKFQRYFIPDEPLVLPKTVKTDSDGYTSGSKMFLASGFYIIVAVSFLRCLVELGLKAFAPTMLMESYPSITPSLGNMINILIIFMGIVGTLIVKFVLYPKYIKSELGGMLDTVFVALPFCIILIFVGKIPSLVSIISMCVVICSLNAANLFSAYHNMYFAKYGKSATAAGIVNAAASISIVVQSYGVAKIADLTGWNEVSILFASCVFLATILCFTAIPIWNRFLRKTY